MNRSTTLLSAMTISALLAAGCGDTRQDTAPIADTPPAAETPEATPQPDMQPQDDQLQSRLVDHMSRARAADAQAFRQMFPEHEGLVNRARIGRPYALAE